MSRDLPMNSTSGVCHVESGFATSARSGFASARQHFSTLQPPAVACQHFSKNKKLTC
jgi:hypothetical protein